MEFKLKIFFGIFLILLAILPMDLMAQTNNTSDLELSGWIPYWQSKTGVKDAKKRLSDLTIVHPFGFSVKEDGSLEDLLKIKKSPWTSFVKSAKKEGVLVVPTIMWSDGVNAHKILSDERLRKLHIKNIISMVKKGKYDGVDIDYEAKKAETINYFSLFLTELNAELEKQDEDDILSCTIEARTPPESLYSRIPNPLLYANDYSVIGKVCDRVQIMAYDQRNADINLNASKVHPYIPVSDADWVRKVLILTTQTIPKEKLVLGIPTYGHEYIVTLNPGGKYSYQRVRALNPDTVSDLIKKHKTTPYRNNAGEMSLVYPTGQTGSFYYVTWSDAGAIETKVNLAKEFDLRGVALFKIDGIADKNLWDLF